MKLMRLQLKGLLKIYVGVFGNSLKISAIDFVEKNGSEIVCGI